MPITRVVFFREVGGEVPFLDWFGSLSNHAKDQCAAKLTLLRALGHQLRRPAAENLGGGIYELRAKSRGVNYRMLYFFDGQKAIVLSHGLHKQQARVPAREIEIAKERMDRYRLNPKAHTHEE
jgi:phage-related protein